LGDAYDKRVVAEGVFRPVRRGDVEKADQLHQTEAVELREERTHEAMVDRRAG
jgi:hypothetical protein